MDVIPEKQATGVISTDLRRSIEVSEGHKVFTPHKTLLDVIQPSFDPFDSFESPTHVLSGRATDPAKQFMYTTVLRTSQSDSHTICESFMARGDDDADSCRRLRNQLQERIVMHQILTSGYLHSAYSQYKPPGFFSFTLLSFLLCSIGELFEITFYLQIISAVIYCTHSSIYLYSLMQHSCSLGRKTS